MRVRVVGGGVVGMAAARRIRAAGHDVVLITADEPAATTSSVAAAIWYPYLALPREAVLRWGADGFTALAVLAEDPNSGVRMRSGRELFRAAEPDPWWAAAVPQWDRILAAELPAGYVDAFRLTVPVIDMARHLPWLAAQIVADGVRVERGRLAALDHSDVDVVVNCAGLGARELCGDRELYAVRGQVVVLANPGPGLPRIEEWILDESEPMTYVVPRIDSVVVGGTADEADEDLTPRPAIAEAMLARAVQLVPELAGCQVLAHRVGLRPARPSVRLELERSSNGPIVHCYGHGGAGVTLAYGCAHDVLSLVESI